MPADPGRLVELSESECFAQLPKTGVGRIAVSCIDGPPEVVPVNYVVDGGCIVFRTGLGSMLKLLRRRDATFEVDHVDLEEGRAWSVVLKGRTYEPSHWETDLLRVDPMVGGSKRQWVRLVPEVVTGRRIGPQT